MIRQLDDSERAVLQAQVAKWSGEVDRRSLYRDIFAISHRQYKSSWPLVSDQACYVFLGEVVSIQAANIFDRDYNSEVTIETATGLRTTTDFCELGWSFGRIISGFLRETGIIDIENITGWVA